MKPFSESCEQNKRPILGVLKQLFITSKTVLEIGSGTGQHAVFFAEQMPSLTWLPSDQLQYHEGIKQWLGDSGLSNIQSPILLDVNQSDWPDIEVDAIFSANTVHIMDWLSVEKMFKGIRETLKTGGLFCLYGPFNYAGKFTSESNARFDQWLKQRDPASGVRDFEAIQCLANKVGLEIIDDIDMPANNKILAWKKV